MAMPLLFQLALFMQVAVIAWFLYTVVSDGVSAKMMTFESAPVEGYDYWRSKYQTEALKGWAIPMVIAALVLGYLAWRVVTAAKKIVVCISGKEHESPMLSFSSNNAKPNHSIGSE